MHRTTHAMLFRLLVCIGCALAAAPAPSVAEITTEDIAPPAVEKPMGPGGPSGRSRPPSAAKAPPAARTAPASSGIQLSRRTTLSSSVHVHQKVLEQCNVETMLPLMIAERNADVTLVDRAQGRHLELKIVDIHAPEGGVFSGPKWITVEGRLVSGKTVQGDFVAKQSSMASTTACGMLHKVMLVMADDIATWLRSPGRGSRLGRAR